MRGIGFVLLLVACLGCAEPETAVEGQLLAAHVREDFHALYDGLKEAHYDLDYHTSFDQLDRRFDELLGEIDGPMSVFDAGVLFQRFVSQVGLGHTRVAFPVQEWSGYLEGGGKILPLFVRRIDGKVYVREDMSGLAAVTAGDQLLEVDGVPIDSLLARLSEHVSADSPRMMDAIFEAQFPIVLWIEQGERESYALTLRRQDGSEHTITMATRAFRGEAAEQAVDEAPEAAQFIPDGMTREFRMLDDGIAYLKPGPFMNMGAEDVADEYDDTEFGRFIDEAFATFLEQQATRLLIDMRGIPGGDNSFSDLMVAWFAERPFRFAPEYKIRVSPQTTASNAARLEGADAGSASRLMAELFDGAEDGDVVSLEIPLVQPRDGARFEGEVFVLIDRHSYSNTAITAAMIQDYGFGTIIGETTSDVGSGFGGVERFTLPHSDKTVEYSKSYFVRPSGRAEIHSVEPDIFVEMPLLPGESDVVLEKALALIPSR